MRKLIALAAVSALGGVAGLTAPGASANCTDQTPAEAAGDTVILNPVTGGRIYMTPAGGTSGHIGTSGSTGYIEAGGDSTAGSGWIEGSTTGGEVNGRIAGSSSGVTVCVNDVSAP